MVAKQTPAPLPLHEKTVAMNEALLLGSLRQHALAAAAELSNVRLQKEVGERQQAEKALRRAQAQLMDRAGHLEGLVADRTLELTVTNRKLSRLARQILTVQEEERKAISRELHDDVVQTLVGINVELSVLSHAAGAEAPALRKKIARTQQLVEHSMKEVHRFARDLRPAVLDDFGLIPALHAYNQRLAERKKIKIHLTAFAGVEALGEAERTVLFRVAQGALTNVVRHAHATRVTMSIREIPGAIRMEIADNGRSFSVAKAFFAKNPKRLGLVGMRERIEMVGGTMTIESAPGKGTIVRADIPFTAAKAKKMRPAAAVGS